MAQAAISRYGISIHFACVVMEISESSYYYHPKSHRRLTRDKLDALSVPSQMNQVWSMDFMSDSLEDGRRLRTFNVLDDYNREALAIEVDVSLPSARIIRVLEQVFEWRGKPPAIRCDNELPTLSSHFQKKESHRQPSKWCHKIFALVPMTLSNAYHSTQRSKLIGLNQLHTAILK